MLILTNLGMLDLVPFLVVVGHLQLFSKSPALLFLLTSCGQTGALR